LLIASDYNIIQSLLDFSINIVRIMDISSTSCRKSSCLRPICWSAVCFL